VLQVLFSAPYFTPAVVQHATQQQPVLTWRLNSVTSTFLQTLNR
jgi:hypothetical protein